MSGHNESTSLSQAERELLAGHVLGDLSDDERQQSETILKHPESLDAVQGLETTAAAVHLALHHASNDSSEIPSDLLDRVRREGYREVGSRMAFQERANRLDSDAGGGSRPTNGWNVRETVAWFAAAAAVVVAVSLWQREPPTAMEISLVNQREQLIDQADGLIRAAWAPGTTPLTASVDTADGSINGDVVWDPKTQSGFMRFVGLPVNDATKEQYQLWIIDPQRDDQPVDGGVFNIAENGEVIVPIDAKLNVISPTAFAITIEKPGGVVVSTQDRLPLLAAVE